MGNNILYYKILPPYMINRNYIHGDEEICNYELLLIELINSSPMFLSHFGKPFIYQDDQSHGESDVKSDNYSLDFKLAISSSAMQANGIFRSQIWKSNDGWIAYGESKNPKGKLTVTYLNVALRFATTSDFERILRKEYKNQSEREIFQFLKVLLTRKHILLFFPYKLWHKPAYDIIEEGANNVIEAIENDFQNALQYRCHKYSELDTFFAFTYEDKFVLTQYKNQKLCLMDIIDLFSSDIYKQLSRYDNWL